IGIIAATSASRSLMAMVEGRSVTPRTSRTVSWRAWPICWAARPTPLWAYMVSNMSATSCLIAGVMLSTRSPFLRRTGVPYLTTSRIILSLFGPIAKQAGEVVDRRALRGANVEAAGGHAGEEAEIGLEAEQFAEAKTGI